MPKTHDVRVISFEQLKRQCTHEVDFYDPSWDQAKGVIRVARARGERLGAERGDLVLVSHGRRSAVYILKMSPHLAEGMIALDYDQQKQMGVLDLPGPAPISMRRARFGTFTYLWKHIDPAIRFPFRISIWLVIVSAAAGAAAGPMVVASFQGIQSLAAAGSILSGERENALKPR